MSPFQLLFGTHARLREANIRELLEQEWALAYKENRDELRVQAKENIAKVQQENRRGFNKKRKAASIYR
jgi:ABC-type phosphonate transport system ATPase subunit